eukprot:gene25693-11390_t
MPSSILDILGIDTDDWQNDPDGAQVRIEHIALPLLRHVTFTPYRKEFNVLASQMA